MGDYNNKLDANNEEVVPTYTLAAAFSLALVMGTVVVSGVLHKPYEAKERVMEIHQRILYEKEMHDFRRMSHNPSLVNYTSTFVSGATKADTSSSAYLSIEKMASKPIPKKTERAENFDRTVRSDEYWASLGDSVRGKTLPLSSKPVVIPPVVIGSIDK